MTTTLARRVALLEAIPPAPPAGELAWPCDDEPAWWGAASPPLRAYLLTTAGMGDDEEGGDAEVADLIGRLIEAARDGDEVPLQLAQSRVLWWRWCAVFHSVTAEPFPRFWGAGQSQVFAATRDATGAALVQLWRRSGTRRLDRAVLRLLAAQEEL
jgi:hypothetical protein